MVSYKCDRCKKVFNRKQTYDGHIRRKNKCDEVCESNILIPVDSKHIPIQLEVNPVESNPIPIDIAISETRKQHICKNCNAKFSSSSNLLRHKKGRCKGPIVPMIQDGTIAQLLKEMNQVKEELSKIKSNNADPKNIVSGDVVLGNKGTTNNNTINNVNIMAFNSNGWESVMTEEACKRILRTGFKAVPNLVEHIHLNEGFPALQNCYIANFRGKYAMTHDGKSWKLVEVGDVIEKLREDKQDYLALKFDEYRKSLDDVTIKRFDKFLVEKDTDVVINQQKEDIKLLLYNNGGMVKKAKK
jgi:hypothetical protein